MRRFLFVWALAAAMLLMGLAVHAEEPATSIEQKVRQLEEQIAAQQAALEQLKAELKAKEVDNAKAMTDTARKEISAEMKKTNLTGFKFSGDTRLRYDGIWYDSSTPDRNRYRFRLRFKVTKSLGYGLTGTFQLASAAAAGTGAGLGDGNSYNQTLGDSFDRKGIWIDQANIAWTPDIPGHFFTFTGGKMAMPFTITNHLVWKPDVSPEGFLEVFTHNYGPVTPFFTFGQLILKENQVASSPLLSKDAYMLAYQGGLTAKSGIFSGTVGVAYYDYIRYSTNYKYADGNTTTTVGGVTFLDAKDFRTVDALCKLGVMVKDHPLEGYFEYAKNRANQLHTGAFADQDTAWNVGFQFGENKKQKDYSINYRYARVEANSVVAVFADPDFGYVNRKGSHLNLKYNIYDNLTIGAQLYFTQLIIPGSGGIDKLKRLLFDLEYKF